jgi:PKD repeat protein
VVHFVTIHPLPIPNFTGTNVCLGLPTVFTDASTNTTGIINSWHWNFGDGGTSNIQNPTHIYASPGNYSVSLAITNTNQCINTIIKQVTVYPLPGVSFTHDSLVCKGTVVQFSNNTFGAQSYLWNFGDGNTSTLTNPTHTYLNQGYYKINLIATSVHGCIDSIANSIHVIQTPTPNFSVTPGHGCAPLNVLIADLTAGSHVIYYWDFGIPPTSTSSGPFNLTYPQGIYDTTYFITLTTSNMCGTASHIDSARVSPQPVVNFHMSQNWGCSPLSIQFLDAIISLPDTLKWDFGDGTSGITSTNFNHPITHTFYYSGTNDTIYTISLIATNKCGSDTMRKTVTEYPNTVNAFFSIDTTFGCEPFTVHFTNYSSGNNQSSWAFGDGNFSNSVSPTHTYTSPGHFVVMLAVTNGCSFDTTYSNPIIVNTRATPNFTFNDNVCHGDTVFFTNLASGITNFLWNFGDGSPESTLSNPYHVYNASGTYALTLTVNNLFNCSSDTTIPIHIRFASNASFSTNSDMGCSPVNVQFTNLTDNLNNNTYFWYFNNGNYSVMITPPLQTFTNSSNCLDTIYNIILIANPNTNCTDTFYSSITVHPLAAPNFTFNDNVCRGDTVFFTNLSTSCITNFSWNFGDGSAESSLLNPYHVYNTSGTNPLTLTANNLFNCPSDITVPVHIRFTPHASFSTNSDIGCSPINEQFVNHTDSLNFNTYIWYFNNGNSSVMITPPLQTFTNYSNCRDTVYNIILIANNVNCIDTFYSSITVHPNPLSNFYSADSIFCSFDAPVSVQFNQQSICAQGFQWYIGNNLASANQNPVITFPGTATYWVGLISSNQYQCVDTATKKFIVYPNLQSNIVINPTSGCEPLGVEFEMLADSLDYIWEFGDNTTSTLSNPFHLYQNNGVYSVHIYITGNGGCTDSLIYNDTIHVNPNAQASFTYQNIHNPPPNNGSILFTNTSQDATSFIWNFGDGTMYYGLDTIHRYLSNNFYDIILISNNQYNCPDTATVRINLDFFDGLFVPNAFSPTNSNSLVQNFNPIGIGLVSFNIQVYDTWGNIIWESSALDSEGRPTEFWDGKTKDGQSLPMDTYVWRATGTFKDGSIWQGMDYGNGKFRNYGTVTILK